MKIASSIIERNNKVDMTKEEQKTIDDTYQLVLSCSVVKIATIQKRFNVPNKPLTDKVDWPYNDIGLSKKIFGFILRHTVFMYGINAKKGIPKECPHLEDWKNLIEGESPIEKYEELFKFISCRPKIEIKSKPQISSNKKASKRKKTNLENGTLESKREIVCRENLLAEQRRAHDEFVWLINSREQRAKIRWSLTSEQMKKIYIDEREKQKMTVEKICIKSNTSKYAVEAIENGSAFDTYIVARLFYFMLTNSDIDDSKYKDQPIELFVDFLAGKTFRFRNYIPHKSRVVENPKACNLPLFLKE